MNYSLYLNIKKLNPNDEAALKEYQKRLSAYCKINHYCKPAASVSAVLSSIKASAHTVLILIQAGSNTSTSEELAEQLQQAGNHGISNICFFIGYDPVLSESDIHSSMTGSLPVLSLSSMDISIGLTGVVLQEQLYRSYRILNHQPYHK